jgi:DNA polymerase
MTTTHPLRPVLAEIVRDLSGYLEYMERLGFTSLPIRDDFEMVLENGPIEKMRQDTLATIEAEVATCRKCRLCEGRSHVVFGAGNPKARLVLIGEGPGYEEDQQGLPFVGEAGQLLTKILKAVNLTREEVYICNIVKCRPPKNRNPEADEIAYCLPYLKRQIDVIHPRWICTLGAIASQTLLETDLPISRLRGKFHSYKDMSVLPTYHPAYLLRYPEKKRDVWNDVQLLQAVYEKT